MTNLFGFSRNVVKPRYALLTPAGFVAAPLPGWQSAACVVLISPALGAGFSQLLITLEKTGGGSGNTGETEWFVFVLAGTCSLHAGGKKQALVRGSYVFLPPAQRFEFGQAQAQTRLLIFQKTYCRLPKAPPPGFLVDHADSHPGLPFLGDPDARLQTLLPEAPSFDMAVNIFTYQPGATLPMVETHVMEHGLLMLSGQGIYRLAADWHPVQAGDVIWMAPFCPQWFVAMGKEPARYIYYKDVNRSPH